MFSSRFFASVYLAVLCAGGVNAFTSVETVKFATHQVRHLGRGLKLESFHPETTYETFGVSGAEHSLTKRAGASVQDSTFALVQEKTGVTADAIKFTSSSKTETGTVAYVRQQHKGIKFANSVANVAFDASNRVTAFGSSFVKPTSIASSVAQVSQEKAISVAESVLGGKHNGKAIGLEYVVKADKSAVLTHVVEVQDEKTNAWFEAFVDAASGELVSVTDFVAQATYRVVPIWHEYPTEGIESLVNPEDKTASPYGWLSTDGKTFGNVTAGNNVIAAIGSTTAPQTSPDIFDYPYQVGSDPKTASQKNAAIVNAFYIVNSVHDISYKYGFTEATFNFQQTNIASGGKGNDRVTVSVQDASGTNNANFATPADGSSGSMRMYLWTTTTPGRDGSLENDIVVHEMTHGITNRMTGGGTGRCLQTTEAGGMGEGWSDAMANWMEKTSADVSDYALGVYVYGKNIRNYPYSTSATTNPLRYSSIKALNEVHNIGEVWANMLHNVYASLVGQYGWDAAARTDPTLKTGNAVFLHLFLDSLLLQPCNPTFASARDAWIQADANRYAGANKCLLWKTFASRGLGVGAASYVDSVAIPAECNVATTTSTTTGPTSTSTTTTSTSTTTSTISTSTTTSSTTTSSTTTSPTTTTKTTTTKTSTTTTKSSTVSPTATPAPGCAKPKCPTDIFGEKGTVVDQTDKLFTCSYWLADCTWSLPEGTIQKPAEINCPKKLKC